jgi:hypothetical protein
MGSLVTGRIRAYPGDFRHIDDFSFPKRFDTCIVKFYTCVNGIAMTEEKNVSVSFRVSNRFKILLEAAAASENRSLTNMLETLLFAYCEQRGIQAVDGSKHNKKLSKRGMSK